MFKTYYTDNERSKYNALTNFTISDRRDGKTTFIKARGFCDFIKNKKQYIYVRRNDSEFEKIMYETFYNDIIKDVKQNTFRYEDKTINEIINYDFLGTKMAIYIRKKGTQQWETLCYLIPLSKAGKLKSAIEIKDIARIEYDEFVPLGYSYLKNEMTLLMELYKSIDSDRDSVELNLYGNRIDEFNPFFDFFDIHLGIQKEQIKLYKDGTVLVEIYVNKEHREIRKESRLNKMVKNTAYEDYNNGGTLLGQNVKIKSVDGAEYFSSFQTSIGDGTIYVNQNIIIVSSNKRKDGFVITDKIYPIQRKQYLCTYGNIPTMIKFAYKTGNLFYTSKECYHKFEPILNKIGGM